MKSEVQELVKEGCTITWESYKLESFVQKFSEVIFNFQERLDDVLQYTDQIASLIASLESCEYRSGTFKDLLDQIQKLIDDLNLRSYSNLPAWVMNIDSQVFQYVVVVTLYQVVKYVVATIYQIEYYYHVVMIPLPCSDDSLPCDLHVFVFGVRCSSIAP